jgi:hypothetical protein
MQSALAVVCLVRTAPVVLKRVGCHLLGGAMDSVFPTAAGLGQCVHGKLFFFGPLRPRAALIVGRRCNLLWLLRVFVRTATLVLRRVGCHLIQGHVEGKLTPVVASHKRRGGEQAPVAVLPVAGDCGGLKALHEARESKAIPFAVAAK